MTDFEDSVRRVVRSIPSGTAMTYGEVAAEAGRPGAARGVGSVLRHSTGLPWWRVVGHGGRLVSPDHVKQARLLEAEGCSLTPSRRVMAFDPGVRSIRLRSEPG